MGDLRSPKGEKRENESGMALFVVLAFLLLVAAVITPVAVAAHVQALVTRNTIRETQDRLSVESVLRLAGIAYAERVRMVTSRPGLRVPRTLACFSDDATSQVTLSFINHSGLIDLNAAPVELLRIGFQALAMDSARAEEFARESESYRLVEPPEGGNSGYKNAPFESVYELGDLRVGENRLTLRQLSDDAQQVFSVRSEAGTLDIGEATGALRAEAGRIGTSGEEFIVEDGGRLPALTVRATITRPGRPGLSGNAVFAVEITEEATTVFAAEPFRLDTLPDDLRLDLAPGSGGVEGCDALLSPEARRAMFEVLR